MQDFGSQDKGIGTITLQVAGGGDGSGADHTNWLDPKIKHVGDLQ
ncbi:MAG: hypothetical protein WCP55_17875 [Lentisphaerota bacterium]